MTTQFCPIISKFLSLTVLVTMLGVQMSVPTFSLAQEPIVSFELEKKFSGPVPDGYTADQFSFQITGTASSGVAINESISLTAFTIDSANGTVDLPVGIYTISETGPVGFVESDWTVQWSGAGCQNQTSPSTSLVVTEQDIGLGNFGCRADNQWKPENNDNDGGDDDDDSDTSTSTGIIIIEKITVPSGDLTEFTFNPSWSDDDFMLTDGGTNDSGALATGTYSISETEVDGWTSTSAVCSDGSLITDISLEANETVTCVFINTKNDGGGDGGGGGDDDEVTYLVFGYVWHDANENKVWDQEQPDPENNENDLDSWTVEITNGSTTLSTTTDETGYYFFNVESGTWTVNEILQSGWSQTYPINNGHVVMVEGEVARIIPKNFFADVLSFLVPTVYAQAPLTFGPFNFGNVFFGTGGCSANCGSDNDNNSRGSSGTRVGGRGGGSGNPDIEPQPLVLGETTDILPIGAPDTGAGGLTPVAPFVLLFTLPIVDVGVRATRKRCLQIC